ncbi:MAG: hypothetical protein ACE5OR_01895 [bacterium]
MPLGTFRNESGGVLGVVLMTTFTLTVLGTAVFYVTNTELAESGHRNREIKAFHLAESGVERAMLWLSQQSQPPAGTEPFDPFAGQQPLDYGTYEVSFDPDDDNPSNLLKGYTISSTGRTDVAGVEKTVEVDVRQESFAKFGLFFDRSLINWNGYWYTVWFTDTDTVHGPCHGNDYIRFYGSAHFYDGMVTSTECNFVYYHGWEDPYFEEGYRLGVDYIGLPANTDKLKQKAAESGWNLSGNTTIRFNPDGTMDIRNPNILGDDGIYGHLKRTVPLPPDGVLHVEGGDIDSLSGVLHGALTVSCENNIYITGHIDYKDDPRVVPSSKDVLGIVAGYKVRIPEGTPDDLRISASVLALHALEVMNFYYRPRQGHLFTFGGLIEKYLYATERYIGSTPVSGYGTSTTYDTRLPDYPPPWFPTLGTYSVVAWREL